MRRLALYLSAALLVLPPVNVNATSEDSCFFDEAFFNTGFFGSNFFDEASCVSASVFDLTGLPLSGDWEPYIDILALPEFIQIKLQECDGDGVWAQWRAGTSVSPRGTSNCQVASELVRQEANGSAVWARWAPGTTAKNSADLQLDVRAALNADFVPN